MSDLASLKVTGFTMTTYCTISLLTDLVEESLPLVLVLQCFLSLTVVSLQDSLCMACSISPISASRDSSSPFLSSLLDRKPYIRDQQDLTSSCSLTQEESLLDPHHGHRVHHTVLLLAPTEGAERGEHIRHRSRPVSPDPAPCLSVTLSDLRPH